MPLGVFFYFAFLIFMALIKENKTFLKILILSVLVAIYMKVADVSFRDMGNYFASFIPEGRPQEEEILRTENAKWD